MSTSPRILDLRLTGLCAIVPGPQTSEDKEEHSDAAILLVNAKAPLRDRPNHQTLRPHFPVLKYLENGYWQKRPLDCLDVDVEIPGAEPDRLRLCNSLRMRDAAGTPINQQPDRRTGEEADVSWIANLGDILQEGQTGLSTDCFNTAHPSSVIARLRLRAGWLSTSAMTQEGRPGSPGEPTTVMEDVVWRFQESHPGSAHYIQSIASEAGLRAICDEGRVLLHLRHTVDTSRPVETLELGAGSALGGEIPIRIDNLCQSDCADLDDEMEDFLWYYNLCSQYRGPRYMPYRAGGGAASGVFCPPAIFPTNPLVVEGDWAQAFQGTTLVPDAAPAKKTSPKSA